MKETSIVVARLTETNGIGNKESIPWKLKDDMKYFAKITQEVKQQGKQNAVIMGRKTWFSIPEKFRPLKNRCNIILSKNLKAGSIDTNVFVESSLEDAFIRMDETEDIEQVFIIGGSEIYSEALKWDRCKKLYITEISGNIECDAFFPEFDISDFELNVGYVFENNNNRTEGNIDYAFCLYERRKTE